MAITTGTYTYDKSFNYVPAAQLLNLNVFTVNGGGGWIDITDYLGNTLRFHLRSNSADGATIGGNSVTNNFTDYKGDPGNGGVVPPNIIMIDTSSAQLGGQTMNSSTILARVINGEIGFGQFGNTIVCVGHGVRGLTDLPYNTSGNYEHGNFVGPDGSTTGTLYAFGSSGETFTFNGLYQQFGYSKTGIPSGNNFNNTEVEAKLHGSKATAAILIAQNNPTKVNNTVPNKVLNGTYQDGNHPISYGELFTNSMWSVGTTIPTGMVGGKFEMVKAHLPLNASIDATYIGNSVIDGVPVANLPNADQTYLLPINNKVLTQVTTGLGGAVWSAESPG